MMPGVDSIAGSLLALAVGDALGLPYEGLPRGRIARLRLTQRYRLVRGCGMVSDDTDHAAAVVLALAASRGDPDLFERHLRRRLRRWFLTLPAGIGLGTAKACIRMCLGMRNSGVRSAGNGPAMRAPVLGAAIDDDRTLVELVRRSTRVTHTDPRAFQGALAVALAARHFRTSASLDAAVVLGELRRLAPDIDATLAAEIAAAWAARGVFTPEFALSRGHVHRVSGFIVHTVPVALHAAFSHPESPVEAALACIACGGDTDTTAAIAAGIVGARTGSAAIPEELLNRIWDWPRGVARLRAWADGASGGRDPKSPVYLLCLARNLAFFGIVLVHAIRRLLPPY